jgi:hypothetical protein
MNTRALGILALSLVLCASTVHIAFALVGFPLTLSTPAIVGTDVQIAYQGNGSALYVLQGSTDLSGTNWTNIQTNRTTITGQGLFTDKNAMSLYPQRFYRAKSYP